MTRTKQVWFPGDKATHEWIDAQKSSTRSAYQTKFQFFLEFTRMSGDEILADRKQDQAFKWEQKVLDFKRWMKEVKKQSDNSAKALTMLSLPLYSLKFAT